MVGYEEFKYSEYVEGRTGTTTTGTNAPGDEHSRPRRGEPFLGLVSGLAHDVTTLIRQEGMLVRVELTEKLETARAGVQGVLSGALVTFAGAMFLILAGVLGLDTQLQRPWLSCLIVGGIVTIIGAMVLARGKSNLTARNLMPERAKESLKQDAELVRDEVR
jgi:hypothetical protein